MSICVCIYTHANPIFLSAAAGESGIDFSRRPKGGWPGGVRPVLGTFPIARVSNGHTFFVQKLHEIVGVEPVAVHTTYQVRLLEMGIYSFGCLCVCRVCVCVCVCVCICCCVCVYIYIFIYMAGAVHTTYQVRFLIKKDENILFVWLMYVCVRVCVCVCVYLLLCVRMFIYLCIWRWPCSQRTRCVFL